MLHLQSLILRKKPPVCSVLYGSFTILFMVGASIWAIIFPYFIGARSSNCDGSAVIFCKILFCNDIIF
jgi:hypothetical protein